MLHYEELRKCKQGKRYCFAFTTRGCLALSNTDFGDKPCPFYKTRRQIEKEEGRRVRGRSETVEGAD